MTTYTDSILFIVNGITQQSHAGDVISISRNLTIASPSVFSVGVNILFATGLSSPTLQQSDNTTNSATGQALTVQAQNATGTTSTGGALSLTSGTGTSLAGNVLLQTGGTTQVKITPTEVDVTSLAGMGTGVVGVDNTGKLYWTSPSGGGVTWANDLAGSTATNQYVAAISGNAGAGGTVPLNITSLAFASGQASPSLTQSSTSTASGQNLTISAQSATGGSHNGGNLILAGGTSGSATAGNLQLQVAGATALTINATGVVTVANLSTGVVHADSSGNLTSSSITGSDIAAGSIAVNKLTPGTSAQFLISDATPTATWTTMSGDGYLSPTGALTVISLSGESNQVLVDAANLYFENGVIFPEISQLNLANGNTATAGQPFSVMSQNGQNALSGSNNGGNGGTLLLSSGMGGTHTGSGTDGVAGTVAIQTGGVTQVTVSPTAITLAQPTTLTAAGTALTVNNNATITGTTTATGGVLTSSVDTATATTLNLGTTTANKVQIGSSGNLTEVLGNLKVDGTETIVGTSTFQSAVTFDGNVTVADGYNFTVVGATGGNYSINGNSASSLTTNSGASLTVTAGAASTWSTSAGALTVSGASGINLQNNGSTNLALTGNGVQLFSGTTSFGGGIGVLGITNAGTAPTSNPSNGAILYSVAGVLNVRQSDGTTFALSGAFTAGGDLSGTSSSQQVISLTGSAGVVGTASSTTSIAFNQASSSPTVTQTAVTAGNSSTAGQTFTVQAQTGQSATSGANNGGAGGVLDLYGGSGGTAISSAVGGAGGAINISGGAGGAVGSNSTGGAGGSIVISGGAGAAGAGAGNGGNGGAITITSGTAGVAGGGGSAGSVGNVLIQTGGTTRVTVSPTSVTLQSLAGGGSQAFVTTNTSGVLSTSAVAAGGDLSGNYPNPTVASFTGSSGTFAGAASVNTIQFNVSATTPVIGQAASTAVGGNGQTFTVQAQNELGSGSIGGYLALTSGSGTTAAGEVLLQTGGTTRLTVKNSGVVQINGLGTGVVQSDSSGNLSSSAITLSGDVTGSTSSTVVSAISGTSPILVTPAVLEWTDNTISPKLTQATTTTGNANNLIVQAQSATGAGNNGGTLILAAGTSGSANAGSIQLVGTTVSVGGGAGVIGITNASVTPTSNPSGGAILYSTGGVLHVLQSDGTTFPIAASTAFTAGGDLTGTSSSQQVISLTGTSGTVGTASSTTTIAFNNASTTPSITQSSPALGDSQIAGQTFTVQAQAGQSAILSGHAAGVGGEMIISGGTAGVVVGGVGGANGGAVTITGGAGGAPGSGAGGAGGNVVITTGTPGTGGSVGTIQLQLAGTSELTISSTSLATPLSNFNFSGGTANIQSSGTTVLSVTSSAVTSTQPISIGSNTSAGAKVNVGNNVIAMSARNAANTGNISLLQTDNSNDVIVGDASNAVDLGLYSTTSVSIASSTLQFLANVTSPSITQPISVITGQALTISAQASSGGTGGALKLSSGTGTTAAGNVLIQTGGSTAITVNPSTGVNILSQLTTTSSSVTVASLAGSGTTYVGVDNTGKLQIASSTAGGDLTGNLPNPTVQSLNGAATITIGNTSGTTNELQFANNVGNISITQATKSAASAGSNGSIFTIESQAGSDGTATTGGNGGTMNVIAGSGGASAGSSNAGNGGNVIIQSGVGGTAGGSGSNGNYGSILFKNGTVTQLSLIPFGNLQWATAVSSPTFNQAQAGSGAGQTFTIQAQQGASGSSNGGNLVLSSGASGGSGTDGSVYVETGSGNVQATFSPTNVTLASLAGSGTGYVAVNNSGVLSFAAAVSPGGSAGGDLSGTYPNPTVAKIQGNTVTSGALTKGQFFVATTTSNWAATSLSGDLSESASTPGQVTVTGIQGNSFTSGSPTKGQFVVATSTSSYGPVTLTGDISESATSAGSLTVQSISYSGTLSLTPPTLQWLQSVSSPTINQTTISTASTNGQTLTIQAQNAAGTTSTGGQLTLASGTGTTAAGNVLINTGSSTQVTVTPTNFTLASLAGNGSGYVAVNNSGTLSYVAAPAPGGTAGGDLSGTYPNPSVVSLTGTTGVVSTASSTTTIQFNTASTSPTINQADKTTNSGTGATLTIQAQNETGTSSTGGNLALTSGTGTTAGNVLLQTGGTTQLTVSPTSLSTPLSNLNFSGGTGNIQSSGTTVLTVASSSVKSTQPISVGTNPATTGYLNLPNNTGVSIRNAANTSDIKALYADSSNNLWLGYTVGSINPSILYLNATTAVDIYTGLLQFDNSVTSPTINHATKSVGTGNTMTIQAQSTTASGQTGGALYLESGTGPFANGAIYLAPGGTTALTVNASNVITIANLSTGVVHSDSSGNLTSSTIVNADISASANIAVSKIAPGTSAQVLMSNGTPATTWTTLSGDVTISATGSTTVNSISGSSPLSISPANLQWTSGASNPKINQANVTTSSTNGQALTIQAQNATGTTSTGGELDLTSGTGTSGAGNVVIQTGGTARLTVSPTSVTLQSLAGSGTGYVAVNNSGVLSFTSAPSPGGTAGGDLSGTFPNPTVAKVDGVSYPASPSTNTVPVVTASNTVTYQQIADAQVSATAAISGSKISPNFGTQAVVGASFDTSTATTLSLGTSTANKVQIGSSGNLTEVLGNLKVDGTETIVGTSTFQSAVTFDGSVTIADGYSFTVVGATAGNYSINGATASSVTTNSGASLTITAGAASTWSTSAGALTLSGNTGINLQTNGTTIASTNTNQFVFSKGMRRNVRTVTASGAITATDDIVAVGTISANISLTLPTSPSVGDAYEIKDTKGLANTKSITLDSGSGNVIDAAQTFIIDVNYASLTLVCTGTSPNQWSIM